MLAPLSLALGLSLALAAPPDPTLYNVEWLTPTKEPGTTQGGLPTYQGALPLGNGATTALVWANVSAGGFGVYVGHQDAMSSWTELFKLARLEVLVDPNPFLSGTFFNNTLDLSSATVYLYAGGPGGNANAALQVALYVDANDDVLVASLASPSGTPFTLTASLISVRPPTVWSYSPPFAVCAAVSSQPDVFVDPLPAAAGVRVPPPQSGAEAMRHASGARLRRMLERASSAAVSSSSFHNASAIIYHRNVPSDGLSLNTTLSQQGLASLIATTPDYWQDNQVRNNAINAVFVHSL